MSEQQQNSFEASFSRLEQILEQLNGGQVSLDDSLKLYEEANGLIISCNDRLNSAEQRIAMLVKSREGEIAVDPSGQPQTEPLPGTV